MKRLLIAAPLALAAMTACSDNTSPASLTLDDQRQAAVISATDATTEDVGILYASDLSLGGSGASGSVSGGASMLRIPSGSASAATWSFGSNCSYSASTSRFSCAPITGGGLTLTRDYAFYDASGAPQSAYDANTTASANFHVHVSGVHVAAAGNDTVSRDRNVTVSGLAGAETSRTWNGTSSRNDGGFRTATDATRRYHVSDDATIANVVVKLPRSTNPWPMSGTITRHVNGTGSVSRNGGERSFSVTKTVVITFNGTQFASVTVDGVPYTLDLLNGTATKN